MTLELMRGRHFRRILDVGCAGGILFPELAHRCDHLFGIDVHENLKWTRELAVKEGLRAHLARAAIETLPFESGSFDAVVCLSILFYTGNKLSRTVEELARVLRPGGLLIVGSSIVTPLNKWLYRMIGHGDSLSLYRSDHRTILDTLDRRFQMGHVLYFPVWFPLDSALFFCWRGVRP